MSDIVERLRDPVWIRLPGYGRMLAIERALMTMEEAADEIERLRKRLEAANDPTTNSKSTDWSKDPAQP